MRALSTMFRGKVRDAVTRALPDATFPDAVWKNKWCVHCKPASGATGAVLRYVARYVYRGIISNRSILSITDTHVTFRYKATRTGRRARQGVLHAGPRAARHGSQNERTRLLEPVAQEGL